MGGHPKHDAEQGVSRRGCIASMGGGGAVGAAALGPPLAETAPASVGLKALMGK